MEIDGGGGRAGGEITEEKVYVMSSVKTKSHMGQRELQ